MTYEKTDFRLWRMCVGVKEMVSKVSKVLGIALEKKLAWKPDHSQLLSCNREWEKGWSERGERWRHTVELTDTLRVFATGANTCTVFRPEARRARLARVVADEFVITANDLYSIQKHRVANEVTKWLVWGVRTLWRGCARERFKMRAPSSPR